MHFLLCLRINRLKQEINALLIHLFKKNNLLRTSTRTIRTNLFAEKCACQFCEINFPNQLFISLNLPKTLPQLQRWKELYTCTPKQYVNMPEVLAFKKLTYFWDFETAQPRLFPVFKFFNFTYIKRFETTYLLEG